MNPKLALVILTGSDVGRIHPLAPGVTVVGRHSSCDLQVRDEAVSRKHARLTLTGEELTIEDLNSTSGTWVEDERVETVRPVTPGDRIRVATSLLKVVDQRAGAVVAATPVTVDPLTGLANKRHFRERLEEELREGGQFAVVMFDLDHFKAINGYAGHAVGDEILKHVAGVLDELVPRDQLVARYGGEEFAVLLPDFDPEAALRFAAHVCEVISSQPFAYEGGELVIHLSAGVAPVSTRSVEAMLMAVDDALWRAKSTGRNKACL